MSYRVYGVQYICMYTSKIIYHICKDRYEDRYIKWKTLYMTFNII